MSRYLLLSQMYTTIVKAPPEYKALGPRMLEGNRSRKIDLHHDGSENKDVSRTSCPRACLPLGPIRWAPSRTLSGLARAHSTFDGKCMHVPAIRRLHAGYLVCAAAIIGVGLHFVAVSQTLASVSRRFAGVVSVTAEAVINGVIHVMGQSTYTELR